MEPNFLQWLILLLIGLLFGKDTVLPWIAQKFGFKVNGNGSKEVMADVRNALQPLLSRMEKLEFYANHETTEHLYRIEEVQKTQCKKLDKISEHLEEIRMNGVRIKT